MLETPNSDALSESNCYFSHFPAPRYLQRLIAHCQCVSTSDFEIEPLSEKADEFYGEWIVYDEKYEKYEKDLFGRRWKRRPRVSGLSNFKSAIRERLGNRIHRQSVRFGTTTYGQQPIDRQRNFLWKIASILVL